MALKRKTPSLIFFTSKNPDIITIKFLEDGKSFGKNKDGKPADMENSIGAGGSRSEHFPKINHNPKGKVLTFLFPSLYWY